MRTPLLFVALASCGGMTSGVGADTDAAAPSSASSSSSGGRSSTSSSGDMSSGGEDCPEQVNETPDDLNAALGGWKQAKPAPGACTSDDLAQLQKNFTDTSLKSYFALGTGLTDTCRACVLSKDTDPYWGPIVGTAADNGQTGFVNYGACFSAVDGPACGKAVELEQLCYQLACDSAPGCTPTLRAKCVQTASSGTCKDFANGTVSSCPKFSTDGKTCNSITDAIRTLCGS